jgi:hypothetical protein
MVWLVWFAPHYLIFSSFIENSQSLTKCRRDVWKAFQNMGFVFGKSQSVIAAVKLMCEQIALVIGEKVLVFISPLSFFLSFFPASLFPFFPLPFPTSLLRFKNSQTLPLPEQCDSTSNSLALPPYNRLPFHFIPLPSLSLLLSLFFLLP